MQLAKQLEKLGLTSHEAKVYLAALEVPNGGVADIGRRAGVAKSTAHDVLGNLLSKGLVHKYIKGKRARFTASDPQTLKRKLEEQQGVADTVMPELSARFESAGRVPRVQFYEGEAELEKVFDQITEEAEELMTITSPHQTFANLPNFFPDVPKKRLEAGIPLRAIFTDSKVARERAATDKEFLRTTKLIKTENPFGTLTYIWQNKVALISFKHNYTALLIENKDIADSYRVTFETLWEHVPDVR